MRVRAEHAPPRPCGLVHRHGLRGQRQRGRSQGLGLLNRKRRRGRAGAGSGRCGREGHGGSRGAVRLCLGLQYLGAAGGDGHVLLACFLQRVRGEVSNPGVGRLPHWVREKTEGGVRGGDESAAWEALLVRGRGRRFRGWAWGEGRLVPVLPGQQGGVEPPTPPRRPTTPQPGPGGRTRGAGRTRGRWWP